MTSPEEQVDLDTLKEKLNDRRMAFFERMRELCRADEKYRHAMGCREFEPYVKRMVEGTAKELETLIRAHERKWPHE